MPNPRIPKFTRNQLDLRKEAQIRRLNGQATPAIINFQNGKTGWIRMTSGVDISDADLARELGVSTGNQLAKNKILQAGELYIAPDGKYTMRAAIGNLGGAYGDSANGNRGEFGIRPMAGIVSLTVDGITNYGATRNATVKIKCSSKKELDALLILYCRLGHSVLIEWGWSQFFNNPANGDIKNYPFDKLESKINYYNILDNTLVQEQIYRDIFDYTLDNEERERRKNENIYEGNYRPKKLMELHSGNYEAFFGFVKNFSWVELENNTYEITTVVMGIGEFIEGTKAEYVSKVEPNKFLNTSSVTPAQKLDFFIGKLNGTLNEIYNRSKDANESSKDLFNSFNLKLSTLKELALKTSQGIKSSQIPVVTSRVSVNNSSNFECYIRFEELIQILNLYMIMSVNNNSPIIKLSLQDNEYEDIQCKAHYLQMSADVSKFLIKQCSSESLCPKTMKYAYFDKTTVDAKDTDFFVKGNKNYNRGLIKNIYLNVNYLIEVVAKSKTPDGTYLYDFLTNIFQDLKVALGGINDFDLRVDPYSNVIRIYDKEAMVDDMGQPEYNDVYKMELNGAIAVVRNYSMESVIDSKTASAIVIATRGLQIGEVGIDNSNIALLNYGTQDRHMKVTGEKTPSSNTMAEKVNFLERAKLATEGILKYVYSTKMTALERNNYTVPNVPEALKKLIEQEITINKQETDSVYYYNKNTVPLRINLTMDGVAGLNVGQVFRISDDRVPIGYGYSKNKLFQHCFIVTNISHRIDNNDWTVEVQGSTRFVPTKDLGNIGVAKIFQNTSLGDPNSTDYKNIINAYLN